MTSRRLMPRWLGPRRSATIRHVAGLVADLGSGALVVLGLMVTVGLVQGAGLMLLIPLLQIVGLGDVQSAPEGIGATVRDGMSMLGLPMTLPVVLVVVVALVAAQALLTHVQTVYAMRLVQRSTRRRQNDLFRKVAFASWTRLLRSRASDLSAMMIHDIGRIELATENSFRLVGDLILVGVYLSASFVISARLAALTLASGLFMLVVMGPLNSRSRRSGERFRRARRSLHAGIDEQLSSLKLSKAFGQETTGIREFERATAAAAAERVYFTRVQSFVQVWYQVGGGGLLALFVFVAARWLGLPASEYLVMIVIFARLMPRISLLHQTWQRVQHCLPSVRAVGREIMRLTAARECPAALTGPSLELRTSVELRAVRFRYGPRFEPTLKGVDLRIPARQLTAILGPSGAGKTTLADVLIGLIRPEHGQVLIDGQPLAGDLVYRWRASVGYVPQESFLFHDTLRANLLWARPGAAPDELWRALRLAAAEEFVAGLVDGLDTVVGDRGERLSGGERQRIALARALLIQPALLLLDEATSQVDAGSQQRILDAVAALRGETTVVIIAHHAPIERIADHVVVLEQGAIR